MKRKGIMWITGLLTLCLCVGVLTGCGGQTVAESTTAAENAAEQTGDTDEENTTAESGETKGEETGTQAESETVDPMEELYPGPVYKINWLDVEFPFERITGYMTNGEVVYIRGKNQTDVPSFWREQVISCDPDGTNQKVVLVIPNKMDQRESDVYRTYFGMSVDSDGNLLVRFRDYHHVNGQTPKNICYLQKMDRDGNVLWEVEFPENVYETTGVALGNQLVCTARTIGKGGAYDKTLILVYDKDGNLIRQHGTGVKSSLSVMVYDDKLYLREPGNPYSDYDRYREFDLETGERGEEFADGLEWYGTLIGSGCGHELLVMDSEGIWGYALKGVGCVKVLDFALSGIDPGIPETNVIIRPRGDSDFLMIIRELEDSSWAKSRMAILTKATWNDIKAGNQE